MKGVEVGIIFAKDEHKLSLELAYSCGIVRVFQCTGEAVCRASCNAEGVFLLTAISQERAFMVLYLKYQYCELGMAL